MYDSHDIFHFWTKQDQCEFNLLPHNKSERKTLGSGRLTTSLVEAGMSAKVQRKKGNEDANDPDEYKSSVVHCANGLLLNFSLSKGLITSPVRGSS